MSLPLSGTTINPDWAELPDADTLADHYPPLAMMMQLEGRAVIECKVAATGRLNNCSVESESPAGLGFGRATVAMADSFKMRPMSLDGAPVDGATVRVPLRFALPEEASSEAMTPTPAPRSPQALALGRRISAVVLDQAQWTRQVEGMLTMVEESENAGGGVTDTPERRAAYGAVRGAMLAAYTGLQERVAATYAADLTDAELTQIALFMETPAGRAFLKQDRKLGQELNQSAFAEMPKTAAQRFCAQVRCERAAAATAAAKPGL
jgi:TonB family protein